LPGLPEKEIMITAEEIYNRLYAAYGQPRWWSDDPYMVMVQAILVQNTAWSSVEKVTDSMADKMTPKFVLGLKSAELESMIRPCGFCKGKAATIRRLTEWYGKYNYQTARVEAIELQELRKELLAVKGIGAETADVLLVYAFHKPSFVIDAYTRRFLERLGFHFASDDEIRNFFKCSLERDYRLYGWYHWLILEHGIKHCRKEPSCKECPFAGLCDKC